MSTVACDGLTCGNKDIDENNENEIEMDVNYKNQPIELELPSDLLPVCEHVDVEGNIVVGSKFSIPISCAPLMQEGYYYMEIKLYIRENRGGEYCIPISKDSEGIMISCSSY